MILTIINLIYVFCLISISSWKFRVLPVFDIIFLMGRHCHWQTHKASQILRAGLSKDHFQQTVISLHELSSPRFTFSLGTFKTVSVITDEC